MASDTILSFLSGDFVHADLDSSIDEYVSDSQNSENWCPGSEAEYRECDCSNHFLEPLE